jgi:ADP-ribosyl-[dinitrogen reductase] hydrolase
MAGVAYATRGPALAPRIQRGKRARRDARVAPPVAPAAHAASTQSRACVSHLGVFARNGGQCPRVARAVHDHRHRLEDRFAGVLLGTAIGDALGLPAEGLSREAIARRFGRLDRFRLLGETGFVSDDTEQSALIAASLCAHPRDLPRCVAAFRRALLGWFLRLPLGIGLGTLRACVKTALGFTRSGVRSAGNGAAMRAAIVGAYWFDRPDLRRDFSDALAAVTHTDPRAVQGARFVAEVAAGCLVLEPRQPRVGMLRGALSAVDEPALVSALERAVELAESCASPEEAADELGTSGFVIESVGFATFCWLRFGDDPMLALVETVSAGGDADSNAAIVGAWLGGQHGGAGLPAALVDRLQRGPFGQQHLRDVALDLAAARAGGWTRRARYSSAVSLMRNLLLFPVVLAHALRSAGSHFARSTKRRSATRASPSKSVSAAPGTTP